MKKTVYNKEKAAMNPEFDDGVVQVEVFHKAFNIDGIDNIDEIPEKPGVFGVFGIIHEASVHPRCVAASANLQHSVRELFERPRNGGLQKYMQGPWVKRLCFEVLVGADDALLKERQEEWTSRYEPMVNENGEYPEYKYVWPYDEIDA